MSIATEQKQENTDDSESSHSSSGSGGSDASSDEVEGKYWEKALVDSIYHLVVNNPQIILCVNTTEDEKINLKINIRELRDALQKHGYTLLIVDDLPLDKNQTLVDFAMELMSFTTNVSESLKPIILLNTKKFPSPKQINETPIIILATQKTKIIPNAVMLDIHGDVIINNTQSNNRENNNPPIQSPPKTEATTTKSTMFANILIPLSHIFNIIIGIVFALSWDTQDKKLLQYGRIAPKQIQQILIASIIVCIFVRIVSVIGIWDLPLHVVRLGILSIFVNLTFLVIYSSVFYLNMSTNLEILTDNMQLINTGYVILTLATAIGHLKVIFSRFTS